MMALVVMLVMLIIIQLHQLLANQNNMAVGAPLGAAKNDGNLGGGNSWKLDKNRGFLEM